MSDAPVKKLPASPRVGSPGIPVADRGSEKVNVGFSDFGSGGSNQLRDPRLRRSAGNDRKFSLGNEFHSGPLLYHIKEVMCYILRRKKVRLWKLYCVILWSILCVFLACLRRSDCRVALNHWNFHSRP